MESLRLRWLVSRRSAKKHIGQRTVALPPELLTQTTQPRRKLRIARIHMTQNETRRLGVRTDRSAVCSDLRQGLHE